MNWLSLLFFLFCYSESHTKKKKSGEGMKEGFQTQDFYQLN